MAPPLTHGSGILDPRTAASNTDALAGFGKANISRPGAAGQQFGYVDPLITSANAGPAGRFGGGQPLDIANLNPAAGGGGGGGGFFDNFSLFGGTNADGL
mgnify:CR=1 FL=1